MVFLFILVILIGFLVYMTKRGTGRTITKTCPFCIQTVHPLAVICPHCQRSLGTIEDSAKDLAAAQAQIAKLDSRAGRIAMAAMAIGFLILIVFALGR